MNGCVHRISTFVDNGIDILFDETSNRQRRNVACATNGNRHTANASVVRVEAFVYQLGNVTEDMVVRAVTQNILALLGE